MKNLTNIGARLSQEPNLAQTKIQVTILNKEKNNRNICCIIKNLVKNLILTEDADDILEGLYLEIENGIATISDFNLYTDDLYWEIDEDVWHKIKTAISCYFEPYTTEEQLYLANQDIAKFEAEYPLECDEITEQRLIKKYQRLLNHRDALAMDLHWENEHVIILD